MGKKEILIGLLAAILIALLLSPFASQQPDGLERVAEDNGFLKKGGARPAIASPVPDYIWPGIKNKRTATQAAGAIGTVTVFLFAYVLSSFLKKRDTK